MPTVGTCSKCNGPVQVPDLWGGSVPPIPTCARCGATAKDPYGPVVPMERKREVARHPVERIVRWRQMSDCNLCEREHVCDYEYKPCDCVHYRKFLPAPMTACGSCDGSGWKPYPLRCRDCKGCGMVRVSAT